jgi:hypothetical protein
MSKLMLMFLNKGTYKGKRVLKPETVEEIFKRSMVSEIDFTDLPPISDKTGFITDLVLAVMITPDIRSSKKAGLSRVCGRFWCLCPTKTPESLSSRTSISPLFEAVRAYFESSIGH